MKITLLRHGISIDRETSSIKDFDRPLTAHGRQKLLNHLEQSIEILSTIDIIICSPSIRTRQTCAILCSMINIDPNWILYEPSMYEFEDEQILRNMIDTLPTDRQHICLIGHNNSISHLASQLSHRDVHLKKWNHITIQI